MDKTVLITGSSRGIGRATAIALAKSGYNIVLHCSKDVSRLNDLISEIKSFNVECRVLAFDISDREETKKQLLKDIEDNGVYYGVVLNAGIAKDNPFPALEDFEWDDVINTNLGGFYNVLKPLCMYMVQARKGRIITISSISGMVGNRGQVNYSASKAGVIGATKALAKELAKRKITVNCVAPGIIESDMTQDIPEDVIKQIPLKRMGKPEEVAGLIKYLMSDDASYITGQVISINGGLVI